MLTVKSYITAISYISEAAEYCQTLRENLDFLKEEADPRINVITLGDLRDAGNHITATIAKIVNLCANEIGDCMTASK